jgi:hypothetical protein
MEHAVFYPGPDGAPAFRRLASLDEAVRFVEHLRNVEGVEDVAVEMLTPVPLAFRPYYRVEVPAADVPPAEMPTVPEQPVMAEPVVPDLVEAELMESVPVQPVTTEPEVAANGKRSLGFFAH